MTGFQSKRMLRHADDVTLNHLIELRKLEQENERLHQLGLKMRNAQKNYFKERSQENLIISKVAEKEFDDALKETE